MPLEFTSGPVLKQHPDKKISFVGGSIASGLRLLLEWFANDQKPLRATVFEASKVLYAAANFALIAPSLTPDEAAAVLPAIEAFMKSLQTKFNQPGGCSLENLEVDNLPFTAEFIAAVKTAGENPNESAVKTQALLALGKRSMELWGAIYDMADDELKAVFDESNFHPCLDNPQEYRVDLLCDMKNPAEHSQKMIDRYKGLGYKGCQILTPDEVLARKPVFREFVEAHSEKVGKAWKPGVGAVLRPGGCIGPEFLENLFVYLQVKMGKYTNEVGQVKDCLRLKPDSRVVTAKYQVIDNSNARIQHLVTEHADGAQRARGNKHRYSEQRFIFSPGDGAQKTLASCGLESRPIARFVGAVLRFSVELPAEAGGKQQNSSNWLELHAQNGDVVLAMQLRKTYEGEKCCVQLAAGGTKAYAGDGSVGVDNSSEFAKDRHVLQLNQIYRLWPSIIKQGLAKADRKPEAGRQLTFEDLIALEEAGVVMRAIGARACTPDGFPLIGQAYAKASFVPDSAAMDPETAAAAGSTGNQGLKVVNGEVSTGLGSGGASLAAAQAFYGVGYEKFSSGANCPLRSKNLSEDRIVQGQVAQFATLFGRQGVGPTLAKRAKASEACVSIPGPGS